MLPITIEVPAGTPVRVVPAEGELTKTAACMEKSASDGTIVLARGQRLKLFETYEADGREFRSNLVILRGI
jgi:hypothetical protein